MKFRKVEDPVCASIWAAVVVVLVATLLFVLIIRPASPTAAAAQAAKAIDQIKANAKTSNLQIAQMQAKIDRHDWKIGSDDITPKALAQASAAAKKSSVTMASFRPGRATVNSGLETIPISITADGGFPNIVQFLRSVESLEKISVSSVQVSELGTGTGQVQAVITAVAFTTKIDQGADNATARS